MNDEYIQECSLKKFCKLDCNECDIEKARQAKAAVESVKEAILGMIPSIKRMFDEFVALYRACVYTYPDKRVAYLALHHRKERVRKKNLNRIKKRIEKGGGSDA